MRGATDAAREAARRHRAVRGHVTKEGAIAGPRVLEHIVDTVLYFEGDPHSSFRLVRAIKNRFGAANELGVFAMTERGLKGVSNPSALFLSQHAEGVAGPPSSQHGGITTAAGRGAGAGRPGAGRDATTARRRPRAQRLALLLAVLHRHGGVDTGGYDVFVNAVGGVRILRAGGGLGRAACGLFFIAKQAVATENC